MKKIQGFPGYFINNKSEVFSTLVRHNLKKLIFPQKPRKLSFHYNNHGYKVVDLRKNKKRNRRFVHRLMLETYVGECPKGMECRHLNGIKTDNSLENLKWGTKSENQMDRLTNNTSNRGERHSNSKLTKKQVIEIRCLAKGFNKGVREIDNGGNYKEIAKRYGISETNVGAIVSRRSWGWV